MLYRMFLSKRGYTFTEVLIVLVVLGILTAIAVPIFNSGYKNQAIKDCNNQKTVISTAFREVLTGMTDNGITQKTVDFSRVQSDHKTTYPGDGVTGNADDAYVGETCFVLVEDQGIPGMIAFTVGDIRGGYFGANEWNSQSAVVSEHGNYDSNNPQKYSTIQYEIGCDHGYYLKKEALENVKFYQIGLMNQEIPVCPFADFDNSDTSDDYHYYIFEDGTVLCNCPHCNEN